MGDRLDGENSEGGRPARRRDVGPSNRRSQLTRRLSLICTRLTAHYGAPRRERREALDELILTVLSQNTSDINSLRAFAALKQDFPLWEEVLAADTGAVERRIAPAGLGPTKAPRIKDILAEIQRREGRLDLAGLAAKSLEAAADYLVSLPGVGPKTAACVLLFSLAKPAFPVDTHVLRVTLRLGLLPGGVSADKAHRILGGAVHPEDALSLHLGLVAHGRELCQARRPLCSVCPLLDLCPEGRRRTAT